MKSKRNKSVMLLLAIVTVSGNLMAQSSNTQFKETILKQLRELKANTLDYSLSDVLHIYDINIPASAEIKDYPYYQTVSPVEITMTVRNGYYNIYKAKINYKVNFYKEFKGNYVLFSKIGLTTIWTKTIQTKEFQYELDAIPSFKNNEFDAIYGPDDNFPADWKQ